MRARCHLLNASWDDLVGDERAVELRAWVSLVTPLMLEDRVCIARLRAEAGVMADTVVSQDSRAADASWQSWFQEGPSRG
jgi:hypothetical protein